MIYKIVDKPNRRHFNDLHLKHDDTWTPVSSEARRWFSYDEVMKKLDEVRNETPTADLWLRPDHLPNLDY